MSSSRLSTWSAKFLGSLLLRVVIEVDESVLPEVLLLRACLLRDLPS